MIQYLKIQNLALLDEITLEFEEGFTCITGETGAGKSVLLGALSMLSGNRLDKTIIRHGEDFCKVEAAIHIPNVEELNEKLRELDLPECEDNALILSRMLHMKKIPKIQINGSMTTLGNLSAIGENWIDFHGPGEPQKLFKERFQLEILDLYSSSGKELEIYKKSYQTWSELEKRLADLKNETQLSEDEIHYLTEQVQKIDELGVDKDSLDDLEHSYQRMSRSEELIQLLQSVQEDLFENGGATDKLASAMQSGLSVQEIDTETSELWKRVESVAIELDDIQGEIGTLADSVNLDDEAIMHLKEKMESWMDLKRKYGRTPEAIIQARDEMAEKLSTHSDIESTLEKLESDKDRAFQETLKHGDKLAEVRRSGAKKLGSKVSENLQKLGFKKALYQISEVREESPKEYGTTRCQMLFAPNAGQPLLPLNKIASSGETARVMLGLKTVLAEYDATPVLVFDEVDANVGGEIGKEVGRELAGLSKNHQIFCVTHLPQVAAQGDEHFVVTKTQTDDSTSVTISPLPSNGEERISELARMLGDRNSSSALNHARELISSDNNLRLL